MKYAKLNDERIEPQKGIVNAMCPVCGELVIPKCGNIKMHHWAHQTKQNCDPWWENETEWHRQWKDCFPKEFQEVIMHDPETGEKHIADVKTTSGFVIEFQHSAMKREEQMSRENFYKNMVWLIDARDYYETFKKHMGILKIMKALKTSEKHKGYFHMTLDYYELSKSCFPKRWLESSVPVVFDFGLHDCSDDENDKRKKGLYCIFPDRVQSYGITYCCKYISEENFINRVSNYNSFFPNLEFLELEQERLKRIKAQQEEERRIKEEYRKEREAIFKEKYPRQTKWREAIFKLRDDIEQNKFKPIKLYVSDKGELTDYNKKIYKAGKCMILSIKSFPAEYKGKEYTRNEALLLLEQDEQIIFATAVLSTYIVNTTVYCRYDFFNEDFYWNYEIRNINIVPYFEKFQLSFEYDEEICPTKRLRESVKYIDNTFAGNDR